MNIFDVKTLISSGTIIIAVILFLVFNNTTEETDSKTTNDYQITPSYAMDVTGNELIEGEYVSTNDGDTFKVRVNGQEERVRLLMIDTPEMNYKENDPMPYAEEAKNYTMNLLEEAEKVEILFDIGPKTDRYGRLLTYVFVDGVLLQEALLQEGYAAVRFVNEPNNTLEEEFRHIQSEAEANGLNIWEYDNYLQKDGFHPEEVSLKYNKK